MLFLKVHVYIYFYYTSAQSCLVILCYAYNLCPLLKEFTLEMHCGHYSQLDNKGTQLILSAA